MKRFGITVLPEYIQHEGIAQVLDRLEDAGVNAVATSPYVMAPADEATGSREPPRDAGAGEVRLLDRPLWGGRRELWVRTAPSFPVLRSRYEGLRYQPPPEDPLTADEGPVIAEFLRAARDRGLRTYFQIQAAIPPAYRVQFGGPAGDDIPLLPDGRQPAERVANQGSLASPHIRGYQDALIGDLLSHYPELDGIRFDWPEYPPYKIDSAFVDFGPHAMADAEQRGLDTARMRRDALRLYQRLHGELTDAWLAAHSNSTSWTALLDQLPGVSDWLAHKESLSLDLLTGFRRRIDACGRSDMELAPSAFPWPWSAVSGMHLGNAAAVCDSVAVKLYGMHWAMMLHFYGTQLLAANPRLSERALVHWLVRLLDIDDQPRDTLEAYRYPGPDQPHPVGAEAQRRKIRIAESAGDGKLQVHILAHGYGPTDDVVTRAGLAWESSTAGIWINRYGYLNDEKLSRIGAIVRAS